MSLNQVRLARFGLTGELRSLTVDDNQSVLSLVLLRSQQSQCSVGFESILLSMAATEHPSEDRLREYPLRFPDGKFS